MSSSARNKNYGTPDRKPQSQHRSATSPGHGRLRKARFAPGVPSPKPGGKRDKTVEEIAKLARLRDERRKSAEEMKRRRAQEIKENERKGRPGDVDFQRMIAKFRDDSMVPARPHESVGELQINVVVRKRPINPLEVRKKDHDSVTCANPMVYVHDCKLRVDGITKYLDNTTFQVDHAFHERSSNQLVYNHTAKPLVEFAFDGGRSTCFAYGQTGSGKTYTMAGVQQLAAHDVFKLLDSAQHSRKQLRVYCSFFELYGGRCIDLLNERRQCAVREDGKGRVCVDGLLEKEVNTEDEIMDYISTGNSCRTTHATEMNDVSSRSHAICQIQLRLPPKRGNSVGAPYGKLSLIDLAGSERGQDTKHHNRQRRAESAEINKSLLALKECIRALGSDASHVPYRASKLTMVLKDSFAAESRTVMISCISPAASSADHTLNTLRYADRVKEKGNKQVYAQGSQKRNEQVDNEYPAVSQDDPSLYEEDLINDLSLDRVDLVDRDDDMVLEESSLDVHGRNSAQTPQKHADKKTSQQQPQSSRKRWDKKPSKVNLKANNSPPSGGAGKPAALAVKSTNHDTKRKPASGTPMKGGRSNGVPSRSQKKEPVPVSSPAKDLKLLRNNLKSQNASKDSNPELQVNEFHKLVSDLVDEEELLLNKHMECIQTNADWLTEEGQLLAKVQGEDVVDYDIDEYATKLNDILEKKMEKIRDLHSLLTRFREHLAQEELVSRQLELLPPY